MPRRASRSAGRIAWPQVIVPKRSSASHMPSTVPGTPIVLWPEKSSKMPEPWNTSGVKAAGAVSRKSRVAALPSAPR
jgi:hypothetical protein